MKELFLDNLAASCWLIALAKACEGKVYLNPRKQRSRSFASPTSLMGWAFAWVRLRMADRWG